MSAPKVPSAMDMAAAADVLTQIREIANGFKRQLEADGWSPTAAEQCAAAFIVSTIQVATRGKP